jgi:hypothetical protein
MTQSDVFKGDGSGPAEKSAKEGPDAQDEDHRSSQQ